MSQNTLGRYTLAGLFNSALGFGIILGGRHWIGDLAANAIAYLVVVPLSFLSHRDFSFRDRGARGPAMARYMVVVLAGHALNVLTLIVLKHLGLLPELAQILAVCTYVGVSYLAARYYVFRNPLGA